MGAEWENQAEQSRFGWICEAVIADKSHSAGAPFSDGVTLCLSLLWLSKAVAEMLSCETPLWVFRLARDSHPTSPVF